MGALSIIGTYNFLNEDEEAEAESDERSQRMQDYESEGPRQIKPEDCYVHRGFNRQYKESDQSRFAMTRHSLFILVIFTIYLEEVGLLMFLKPLASLKELSWPTPLKPLVLLEVVGDQEPLCLSLPTAWGFRACPEILINLIYVLDQ